MTFYIVKCTYEKYYYHYLILNTPVYLCICYQTSESVPAVYIKVFIPINSFAFSDRKVDTFGRQPDIVSTLFTNTTNLIRV